MQTNKRERAQGQLKRNTRSGLAEKLQTFTLQGDRSPILPDMSRAESDYCGTIGQPGTDRPPVRRWGGTLIKMKESNGIMLIYINHQTLYRQPIPSLGKAQVGSRVAQQQ